MFFPLGEATRGVRVCFVVKGSNFFAHAAPAFKHKRKMNKEKPE